MSDERRKAMLSNCLAWIWVHCRGYEEYTIALKESGFSKDECLAELSDCGLATDEAEGVIGNVYGK